MDEQTRVSFEERCTYDVGSCSQGPSRIRTGGLRLRLKSSGESRVTERVSLSFKKIIKQYKARALIDFFATKSARVGCRLFDPHEKKRTSDMV